MITEDYVSFETAKLLKEKGFDELCYACYEYFSSSITMYSGWPFEYKGEPVHNSKNIIKCPTLQMVMKWLREMHNIFIGVVRQFHSSDNNNWNWTIHTNTELKEFGYCKTYEEACEAAIKYCLENLI